jgi:hypothetical protein
MDGISVQQLRHDGLEADDLKVDPMLPTKDSFKQLFAKQFQRIRFPCARAAVQNPAQRFRRRFVSARFKQFVCDAVRDLCAECSLFGVASRVAG